MIGNNAQTLSTIFLLFLQVILFVYRNYQNFFFSFANNLNALFLLMSLVQKIECRLCEVECKVNFFVQNQPFLHCFHPMLSLFFVHFVFALNVSSIMKSMYRCKFYSSILTLLLYFSFSSIGYMPLLLQNDFDSYPNCRQTKFVYNRSHYYECSLQAFHIYYFR